MSMSKILMLLLLPLMVLGGCVKDTSQTSTITPQDYAPLIVSGLSLGSNICTLAAMEEAKQGRVDGCVVAVYVGGVLDTGARAVEGYLIEGKPVGYLPSFEVEPAVCWGEAPESQPEGFTVSVLAQGFIDLGLSVTNNVLDTYGDKIDDTLRTWLKSILASLGSVLETVLAWGEDPSTTITVPETLPQ